MSYYDSKEIHALRKENADLKDKLAAVLGHRILGDEMQVKFLILSGAATFKLDGGDKVHKVVGGDTFTLSGFTRIWE